MQEQRCLALVCTRLWAGQHWCRLRHTVLRETLGRAARETAAQPRRRFLNPAAKNCVAVHPQDVVGTADPQTLSEKRELCLRILAEFNALVHCADDICLAQELVRDELPRPNSDSERAVGGCRGFYHALHVAQFSTRVALHPGRSRSG